MQSTLTRLMLRLSLHEVETAAYLEELLWTLDGVESVTYDYTGDETLSGLTIISLQPALLKRVQALCEAYQLADKVILQSETAIAEEDWAESWKKYWHPNRILPHLVIQPSWEAFTPEPEDIVLKLDPGSAFGTGTHETTQLVLYALRSLTYSQKKPFEKVLDVGTGSGILAIYSAKLGSSQVLAIDNDPLVIPVAQENAERNGVTAQLMCQHQPVASVETAWADLVLANILAPVLQEMMAELSRVTQPGGFVVLSGIIRRQYPEMMASMASHPLSLFRVLQKGEWLALVCQKHI